VLRTAAIGAAEHGDTVGLHDGTHQISLCFADRDSTFQFRNEDRILSVLPARIARVAVSSFALVALCSAADTRRKTSNSAVFRRRSADMLYRCSLSCWIFYR
jgi:hypothetical protein